MTQSRCRRRTKTTKWVFQVLTTATVAIAAFVGDAREALAKNYSYECASEYTDCNGTDIPNACTDAYGFSTVMYNAGHSLIQGYSDNSAYDSDSIDPDIVSGGHDDSYTDTSSNHFLYYAMHGSCGNYAHGLGSCDNDYYCAGTYGSSMYGGYSNLTWACDYVTHTCSGYKTDMWFDRYAITCSSNDTFGHGASITSQMRFGEYSGISWGGAGQNGNTDFVAFDTSCPMAFPFVIEMNSQIFTGLHMQLGFSTSPGGDTGDSSIRGGEFASRMVSDPPQTVAAAWIDAARYDDEENSCPELCTVALSCDWGTYYPGYRLSYETLTSEGDPAYAPTHCAWTYWCC